MPLVSPDSGLNIMSCRVRCACYRGERVKSGACHSYIYVLNTTLLAKSYSLHNQTIWLMQGCCDLRDVFAQRATLLISRQCLPSGWLKLRLGPGDQLKRNWFRSSKEEMRWQTTFSSSSSHMRRPSLRLVRPFPQVQASKSPALSYQ